MKPWYYSFIALLLTISFSFAQKFELGGDLGYGLGLGGSLVGSSLIADSSVNVTSVKQVYESGGNGAKVLIDGAIFINENIGIIGITGFSTFGGYSIEQKNPYDTSINAISLNYIPINIGIKFKAKIGGIFPYMYVAPGLYFAWGNEKRTNSGSEEINRSYLYAPGLGFSSGVGAAIKIMNNLGIRAEFSPTVASANLIQVTEEIQGKKRTIIYVNNKVDIPEGDENTLYIPNQPRHSFSSIAVKAGMYLFF